MTPPRHFFRQRFFTALPALAIMMGSVFFFASRRFSAQEEMADVTKAAVPIVLAADSATVSATPPAAPLSLVKNVLNWETMNHEDPVPECQKAINENGLYLEVYEILRPWTVNSETKADSLPQAVDLCRQALVNLNRESETDAFLEETLAAHPQDWRVLSAVAAQYRSMSCYGVMKEGVFIRGGQGGRQVFSTERDRVRGLQIMTAAAAVLEEQRTSAGVSPEEIYQFYQTFAEMVCPIDREYWRLQTLTDLTTLPDYDENGRSRLWNPRRQAAPVDDEGKPIYYDVPESFAAAKNDGQRWRFLLKNAAESDPTRALEPVLTFADFLREEFGPETLLGGDFLTKISDEGDSDGENADRKTATLGIGSLATLTDEETIARLADGVRRFSLPEGQNYLRLYQKIIDTPTDGNPNAENARRRAAETLGQEYLTRRQFVKAEEVFRKLAEMEASLPEDERTARGELDRIAGNYGAFDPTASEVAGTDASFSWRFRNGNKVRFLVHEINVRQLLDDVKAEIVAAEKNPPKEWDTEKIRLENIGWKLLNDPVMSQKYLDKEAADWTVDLSPEPDHRDGRVTIPFPIKKRGAYLLRGKMENGNSDAIVLWLNDTALVKKSLDGRILWFVADAETGAPIEGAKLDFFGYSLTRNRPSGKRKGAVQNNRADLTVKTERLKAETDADGFYLQKPIEPTNDGSARPGPFNWLVEAATPATDGGDDRFAYYGFGGIWFDRYGRENFEDPRAVFLSDRPVYRPSDPIQYRFWIGTARYDLPDVWAWGGKTVRVTITGPAGTQLSEKEVTLDESGGFEDLFETDADSQLGIYSFQIAAPIDPPAGASEAGKPTRWRNLGFGSVRLEEYKKPEFEVTVDAPDDPVKLGDSFKATLRANYYFGGPVTNARVRYSVTRTTMDRPWFPIRPWDWLYGNGYGWIAPDAPWFPGWKNWGIFRPRFPWMPHFAGPPEVVLENETEIGPDGTVEIKIDSSPALSVYPNEDQSYEITAEVTDASRRTIVGTGKVLVAKDPFKIYAWAEKGFYVPNQQVNVSFQARRLDGKPVPGDAVLKVWRIRYEKNPENPGEVKPVETQVWTETASVGDDGLGTASFVLEKAGQYRFSCFQTDSQGDHASGGCLISVSGAPSSSTDDLAIGEKVTEETFRSNPIELVPEKAEYRSGETVRLKVNTLAADSTVLLFLRSEGGVAQPPAVLRCSGLETIYEFPLTDADQPNIFVEAVTIHHGHYYHDVKEIAVPPMKRILNVAVEPDKADYRPGEKATMKVMVTDPDGKPVVGDVTVAVYDKSLDAVADGPAGTDLKEFFWSWKRHLNPQVDHTLEKIFYPIDFPNKKEMTPLGVFGDWGMETSGFGINSGMGGGADNGLMLREGRGIVALSKAAAPMMAESNSMMTGAAADGMAQRFDADASVEKAAMPTTGAGPETATEEAHSESEALLDAKVRKDFADTALWIGRLTTDEKGVAEFSITMPENLTTWKARVWSFAPGTRVGEGTAETITRKNLILRMQRPRFLTQTDQILLSANVHNYLDREKRVTVSLELDPENESDTQTPLTLVGQTGNFSERILTIPAGGEARADWEVEAKFAGTIPLVMKARTDEESDGMEESLSILLHGMLTQSAVSGLIPPAVAVSSSSEGGKSDDETVRVATFEMTVPDERIPEMSRWTVRFSPTLAGAMIDAIPYLSEFPYGCSEQTLNRFLPTVLTRRLLLDLGVDLASLAEKRANLNPQELGDHDARRRQWNQKRNIFGGFDDQSDSAGDVSENPVFNTDEINRRVKAGIDRMAELQCDDGGWGWFGGWREFSDSHLTALITEGLWLAQEAGADVPAEMIFRGRDWLEKRLARETDRLVHGQEWSEEAKKEAPNDWKDAVSAEDALVYRVLLEMTGKSPDAGKDRSDDSLDRTGSMTRMKDFLWRDRTRLTPYALALYGMALTEETNADNAERIAMTVRMLRQFLKTDETNQTAWLDLAGAAGEGGWRWWSWSGDEIETQAAFLRLLIRTEPNGETAPRLVKFLLNNRKNATYWRSTRDTAQCLVAFADYIRTTGEVSEAQTVTILVDGTERKRVEITPETLFATDNTLEIVGTELTTGSHSVTIRTSGSGPLYYNAYLANFSLESFIKANESEVGVTRKFWRLTEDDSATAIVAGGHGQAISQRVKKFRREPLESGASVQSGDLIEVELLVTSRNDYESLLIEDHKPAGFEAVDPVSGYGDNPLGAYVEFRDARVCFFVHRLPQGSHSLTYRLRAETPGAVSALPATIGGMYAPELKGNSDEFKTKVIDR